MRKVYMFFFVVLCLLLAAGPARFIVRAAYVMATQAELDYGEGIILWQTAHVTDLRTAFRPIEDYPHIVFHYPPLFHLITRAVGGATQSLQSAGRLVSIISLAAICGVLALLAWSCLASGRSLWARFVGAYCAGTLVFTLPVWEWATLARVDSLAMLFTFAGLAFFIWSARTPPFAYAAFICFVGAGFSKQTTVAAPAVCLLAAFLDRPRKAINLLLFAGTLAGAILLLLHNLTDGLFLRHIIVYNRGHPFSVGRLFRLWFEHMSATVAVLSLSVAVIGVGILRLSRYGRNVIDVVRIRTALTETLFMRTVLIAGVYLLFAAIVSTTIGKLGSNYNYFYEVDLTASLLSGLLLGSLADAFAPPSTGRQAMALVALPLILMHCAQMPWALHFDLRYPRQLHEASSDHIVEVLRGIPGPVYSEDMTVLLRAGKEIPAEPAVITLLAENGLWNEAGFLRTIESGRFDAVVVTSSLDNRDRFSEKVAGAIAKRYVKSQEIGPYKIYRPIAASPSVGAPSLAPKARDAP